MFDDSSNMGRMIRAVLPVSSSRQCSGWFSRPSLSDRRCHPRPAVLALALATLVLVSILSSAPGPLHAQTAVTAPGNLQATAIAGGVRLTWDAPADHASTVRSYQVQRRAYGQSGTMAFVIDTGSAGTSYTDSGAAKQGETYTYQVRAKVGSLTGPASDPVAVTIPGTCPISGGSPVDVTVSQVPIVVTSTVDDYFVLYVLHEKGGETVEYPVLVKRGEAGTTALADNLAPLPAEQYRVQKYQVANPADVDGDCIDDLTELADLGTKNPLNPAESVSISNGAVAIADHAAFRQLSYYGSKVAQIDSHLRDLEYVKFIIMNPGSDRPAVYFMNTVAHRVHHGFAEALGFDTSIDPWRNSMHGELVWHPNVVAPDGSLGVYRYDFRPWDDYAFDAVAFSFEALAASMPFLENNLAYYPVYESALPRYHREKALYDASRVNVLLEEGISPDVDFIPFNHGEGYGFLREMSLDERPNPRDIVIYETLLPNDLPRVAGIITGVPQTPLSHVNLRAVQNRAPNAFIRDPLDDATIDDLLDRHVYYKVTQSGYTLRAATRAEVDAHYGASRPATTQTPERDLSVTKITPLSQIGFDDWDAFGVKAANMAVLGTLGFPEGTVRDGFAVPFYFYDEFMKHAGLAEETVFGKGKKGGPEDRFTLPAGTKLSAVVTTMLAHPKFRTDYELQDEMLDDLRDAIKDAQSPAWIITALEEMHAEFPEGTSLRYRSSTNNEDLPGYNGAGLYSSKTQDPDETAAAGIDKSIKSVWASLWNFRAFVEREFHRIDHTKTAMGVLVHPNYSLEKANGVAVSFNPVTNRAGAYYVNTQLGEDLITNPEANSRPEEILLLPGGRYEVLVRSNLTEQGKLLMSDAQMKQLRSHLEVIHNRFSELYGAEAGEPFAMDIEFKITSQNQLSIKQARPWVFPQRTANQSPTVSAALADATIVNESATREISLSGVFADADGDSLTVTATSSDEAVATASVSADYSTLTVTAQGRGAATITVTAADGNGGSVHDSFIITVKAAPVVATAIGDVSDLNPGDAREISLSGVFSDADGDRLTVTAASSDRGVANVSVAADYSKLTVSGVAEGTATITVTAQDSSTPTSTVNQPGAYEGYTLFYHPQHVKFYLIDNQGRRAFEWAVYGLHGKLLDNGNLLSGHGNAHLQESNPRSRAAWYYSRMNNRHDALKMPNGNYLFIHQVWYGRAAAVAAGANPDCLPENARIKVDEVVELTPAGVVAWRWRVWDHLIQDHDPHGPNYGTVADHPEKIDINYGLCPMAGGITSFTNMNALDYNASLNQIMITVRNFSEIWIIDRSTTMAEAAGSTGGNAGKGGGLLYRWGNPRTYQKGTKDDQKLFFPNGGHWIPAGLPGAGKVLVYNNGNERSGFGRGYSSVDEIVLPGDGYGYTRPADSTYGPAGAAWSYRHSDGSLAYRGSNAQRLHNGNTLVVDASLDRIRELTPDKEVVWEYFTPGRDRLYRAYKYAPDHPGVRALPLIPEGDRKPAANLVSASFQVSVAPPNNPPTVAGALPDATIVSESGTHQESLSGVFADADQDSLTVTAASSDDDVATVSVAADYTTVTVTALGRGTATITVTAADGKGDQVEDSFTVTVKSAPAVASAISDVSELAIGDTHQVTLSGVFSDADGDSLTVTANSSNDAVATVLVAADHSGLTVTAKAAGTATITVTAQDSDGNRVNDAFEVTVVKANNAPTVSSAIDDATIINESGTHQVSLLAVFADADQDSLTITATSSDEKTVTVSVLADYSTLTVFAQARGTATITVNADDGNATVEDSFTVKVKSAPVVASAIADLSELEVGATHEVSMSGVFSDADGDALTVTNALSSDNLVAVVSTTTDPSTGAITAITVTGEGAGTATITVTAQDSDGNSVSDAFEVTVPAAEQQQAVELPGSVVGLELTASAEDSVTVSWQAPHSGGAPRGYIVHIKRKGGGDGDTKRPGADKTTVIFRNLDSGSTYEVWVRAQNEAGKGERTHATITLPVELPGPVAGVELTATADSVTVSWQAPETGGTPDGYIVHVSPEDGGKGRTKTPKARKTKVDFKNLEAGRTYAVWVRAQNEAGKGERVHATITLPE